MLDTGNKIEHTTLEKVTDFIKNVEVENWAHNMNLLIELKIR